MAQLDGAVSYTYENIISDVEFGDPSGSATDFTYAWPVITMFPNDPVGSAAAFTYAWPVIVLEANNPSGSAADFTYAYPSEIVSGTLKFWDEAAGVWKVVPLKRRINGQWVTLN